MDALGALRRRGLLPHRTRVSQDRHAVCQQRQWFYPDFRV